MYLLSLKNEIYSKSKERVGVTAVENDFSKFLEKGNALTKEGTASSLKTYRSTESSDFPAIFKSSPTSDNAHEPKEVSKQDAPVQIRRNGLTVFSAAVLIAGEMAGSGVLALPRAVVDAGWIGIILVIVLALNALYGATRLGQCWQIIEERYPEHRGATRNPYPTIALRAVGRWGSVLVSVCIQITLFGAGVVYLLLASQLLQDLLKPFLPHVTFCSWYILFAIVITPPMWLGSPKDFWFVGIGALLTTAVACVLIFSQMLMEGLHETKNAPHQPHSFLDFFLAFGIILFAFGGASTFPTIQNDMMDRTKFTSSASIGFIMILCLYFPVALGGYFTYGDLVDPNIVLSLERSILVTLANLCMALHLVLAFLIVINPVALEIENIFDVPHEFCALRCIVRTLMVVFMVIIGESVPDFAKILALVGGSTVALCTFVLPNYFYLRLCDQETDAWPKRFVPPYLRVYMWELILIGLAGGTATTYSAIQAIFSSSSLKKPCFWS